MKIRTSAAVLCFCAVAAVGQQRATNVIIFLGDAGGIPTLSAGSIYGYNAPQKLFIQKMPHIGLSDTSATNTWVTDSAAGMSAIVTGVKTNNGAISVTPEPLAGQSHVAPVKTILEYAEEHGLSTGVVTNMPAADATPAACYSHAESRKNFGEIFAQVWKPRYGDGVDVVFGAGRSEILKQTRELGFDAEKELRASGREFYESITDVPTSAKRVVALMDGGVDVNVATRKAIQVLSRNPKGYFLMVEWDLHPTKPEECLKAVVSFDKLIERIADETDPKKTLILFTADHSFDFRMVSGRPGNPLAFPPPKGAAAGKDGSTVEGKASFNIGTAHSGEEVLIAAQGPGSERVSGFMHNTDIFKVLLNAFGWNESSGRE